MKCYLTNLLIILLIFSFLSDYLSSELQAMHMIGGDEDKMEIDEEV